jgi:hypothetical protein
MLVPLKQACKQIFLTVSGYRARRKRGHSPFPSYTLPGSNRRYVRSEDIQEYISRAYPVTANQTEAVTEWVKSTMKGLGYETS